MYIAVTQLMPSTYGTTPAAFDHLICPNNQTAILEGDKPTANLSWSSPAGETVVVSLPVGRHEFSYHLPDGTDCYLTAVVHG